MSFRIKSEKFNSLFDKHFYKKMCRHTQTRVFKDFFSFFKKKDILRFFFQICFFEKMKKKI